VVHWRAAGRVSGGHLALSYRAPTSSSNIKLCKAAAGCLPTRHQSAIVPNDHHPEATTGEHLALIDCLASPIDLSYRSALSICPIDLHSQRLASQVAERALWAA
jgi:hypothetical protein